MEVDGLVVAIGAVTVLVVILLVKSTHRFTKNISQHRIDIDDRIANIEKEVVELKSRVDDSVKAAEKKIDCAYLDKRIDGLVGLINGRASGK